MKHFVNGELVDMPVEDAVALQAEWNASGVVDLAAYARLKRWQVEVGGITIGGVPVATDDRSKIMIVGARVAASADPGWTTIWQGTDGVGYPINAAAMIAISNAVEAHVNGTFATLATVLTAIESGTKTTKAEIDAAFAALPI